MSLFAGSLQTFGKRNFSRQSDNEPIKRPKFGTTKTVDGVNCTHCARSFKNAYSLHRHENSKHAIPSSFSCHMEGCRESFTRKDTLLRHQRTQHQDGKLICKECGDLIRKDGMLEHLKTRVCLRKRPSASTHPTQLSNERADPFSIYVGAGTEIREALEHSVVYEPPAARDDSKALEAECNSTGAAVGGERRACSTKASADNPTSNSNATCGETPSNPEAIHLNDIMQDYDRKHQTILGVGNDLIDMRDSLKPTGVFKHAHTGTGKPQQREFLRTRKHRQRFERMRFGSRCVLCSEPLGDCEDEVFQHAKSHARNHGKLHLECTTCGMMFAFERDFDLHASEREKWSFCRRQSSEPLTGDSWLLEADANDRLLLVEMLRKWEWFQLLWYLSAIRTLLLSHGRVYNRTRMRVRPGYQERTPEATASARVCRDDGVSDIRTVHTTSCVSVGHYAVDESVESLTTIFSKTCFKERRKVKLSPAIDLSYYDIYSLLKGDPITKGLEIESNSGSGFMEKLKVYCPDNASWRSKLGLAVNAAVRYAFVSISEIQDFLERGAEVDAEDENGYPTLFHAIDKERSDITRLLIQRGANVERRLRGGLTALHLACAKRRLNLVRPILDAGAEVNAKDCTCYTPLMMLFLRRSKDADPSAVDRLLQSSTSFLDLAALDALTRSFCRQDDRTSCLVQNLFDCGADIDASNNEGSTALMLAVMCGNVDAVAMLLRRGARIDIKDKKGRDVFMISKDLREKENVERCKLMLEASTMFGSDQLPSD